MSFARQGCEGSDIYCYATRVGYECFGPHSAIFGSHDERGYRTMSAEAFLHHLREHQGAGHCVPDSAFESFREHLLDVVRDRLEIT